MPDPRADLASKEGQAAAVLAVAERLMSELESSPQHADRDLLLLQASFLNRLAAALPLEANFPSLPGGFGRLLDRDRARTAARQLADSRERQYRSYAKKGAEPTPRDRKPGRPYTEIDLRLAASYGGDAPRPRGCATRPVPRILAVPEPQ